jgi:acyl-CoA synthetase (NDP forming)
MSTDLSHLLRPRAIAVVGATQKPGKVGRIVYETLLRADRPVYPVHPKEVTVLGHRAFANVADLPADVDLAVITTGATAAVVAAQDCAKKGIPFVIPVAGGFSEVGPEGRALEDQLAAVCKPGGTRILGPNTLGVFVPQERLDTIFVEHGDRALASGGGVAFITQSGSVGTEALGVASNIGFGLRAFIGLGNKIDLDEIDFLRHFGADARTTCVALYMESMTRGRKFLEVAREIARTKPVVALKAGRTERGAVAVSSHTGRLAGSDRVIGGAMRQFGVQRVFDEEQLCDAARILSSVPPPRGPRVAVVSPGGGYGVMATDYLETPDPVVQLEMAELSETTRQRIAAMAPAYASLKNPVDLTAVATDDLTIEALRALLDDDGVDMVLCFALFAPPGISDALVHRIATLRWESDKPIVLVVQYGPFTDGLLRRFYDGGVVGFPSTARAVRGLRWLWQRSEVPHDRLRRRVVARPR